MSGRANFMRTPCLRMIVTMHAIEVAEIGGPEVLSYVEKPQPSPGPGEVLIEAEAIGVNFIDTYFRSGTYPRELPFVLGTEVAGTVAAVGDGVTELSVGDRVATSAASGAYAEFSTAPAQFVAHIPSARRPGRGRFGAAEGPDGALPDHLGVCRAVRRRCAGARRRRRSGPDPDAVVDDIAALG